MKSQIDVIDVNERNESRESWEEIQRKEKRRMQEKKRRMRKKRQQMQLIRLIASTGFMILVLLLAVQLWKSNASTQETGGGDKTSAAGDLAEDGEASGTESGEPAAGEEYTQSGITPIDLKYEVRMPEVLEGSAITERLDVLVAKYPEFQEIRDNAASYPENLLAALCNNPEMIDFVKGYLTADTLAAGELTEEEKTAAHPHFLQWDSRWGYTSYGDDILALSGCGPTCLSMVTVALTDNKDITPAVMADYAMNNDYYMAGTGTMWKLMTEGAVHFGLDATELEIEETAMKNCIDGGGMMIATMAPGDFTAVGHFIVIYGYDEEGFFVNDPNCLARSQKKWTFDTIAPQMKKLWGYR
ncbi:MAG: C39 family peptidase [Roseburia sp.]